jgi:hypothetical protein
LALPLQLALPTLLPLALLPPTPPLALPTLLPPALQLALPPPSTLPLALTMPTRGRWPPA